ncbi:MAG: tetratricopeptide repeat protein [Hyphomicrobiaceae bacterium]
MPAVRLRLCAYTAVAATLLLGAADLGLARQAKSGLPQSTESLPLMSHLGSYLAGRVAQGQNETEAAVHFYRRAVRNSPEDGRIVERLFLMEAMEGDWQRSLAAAQKLIQRQPDYRLARYWLGIAAFRTGQYSEANEHFQKAATGPIGELTSALARAWTAVAQKNGKESYRRLRNVSQADWSRIYVQFHRALIADVLGNRKRARENYERIFALDALMPRRTAAYIRHAIYAGDYPLATRLARAHFRRSSGPGHVAIRALYKSIEAGDKAELLVATPQAGLAEVFYGLGEALTSEGGVQLGTIYLQMALALKPQFPAALASLASVYESTKRYGRANNIYDRIDTDTPLLPAIEIRKAVNLNSLDRVEDAKAVLDKLADERPKDIRPLEAVGNIMRSRKRFKEAIKYYTRLLKLLPKEKRRHWTYWYARGTSYERIKDWPNAERDLLKALDLDPDQALTLNYLGYSWVDQNVNLQRGLKLIEKAVELKPDDGYIVDSLGWAHYRLGNFEDAVRHLERAVELRPEDPILNDHLGDALWQVGRRREARFQWKQALTLKPEEKDAIKIREKLISGMPPPSAIKAVDDKKKQKSGLGKRAATTVTPGPAALPMQ